MEPRPDHILEQDLYVVCRHCGARDRISFFNNRRDEIDHFVSKHAGCEKKERPVKRKEQPPKTEDEQW